jgi:cyclohexanone monooxygenase
LWADGPNTYLGMMVARFPNMFLITGPGSPSVLTNMIISIEQHVDWIAACLAHMKSGRAAIVEAREDAQANWMEEVRRAAEPTIHSGSNSWYLGANVPGKPRVFMPYIGGAAAYNSFCKDVADNGYTGMTIR